jgi:hypothetical protein
MSSGVTLVTERDQVLLGVVARMAAKLFVANLQVRHRAAGLTPPAIATQDLLPPRYSRSGLPRIRVRQHRHLWIPPVADYPNLQAS